MAAPRVTCCRCGKQFDLGPDAAFDSRTGLYRRRGSNFYRFSPAVFRHSFVSELDNTPVFPALVSSA